MIWIGQDEVDQKVVRVKNVYLKKELKDVPMDEFTGVL